MRKRYWDRLLKEIRQHRVVPIIGSELLRLTEDNETFLLYERVAIELARELEIEFDVDDAPTINQVAIEFRDQGGDTLDVYYQVSEILQSHLHQIPEPLQKLAEIRDFDLFLSTTPDDLMARALNETRFGGERSTTELAFSPNSNLEDLKDGYSPEPDFSPVVYRLFGNSGMAPDFVVTEDDILRYVSTLQNQEYRPENLFDVLYPRSLAWIGASFPNWLLRFMLCSTKGESLFLADGVRGYVANQWAHGDANLKEFLNRQHAVLFDSGDACDFVDELHGRWLDRFGCQTVGSGEKDIGASIGMTPFPKNGVFISYASEDRSAAESLRRALGDFGIQAWLDTHELRSGDIWSEVIQQNIESCSIFLPLISQHTQTEHRRYFRAEWNMAIRESDLRPDTHPFIQPIRIDDSDPNLDHVPQEFRRRHIQKFPSGIPNAEFLDRTKRLLRHMSRLERRVN
ncbi:MAG: toll/interleukin-1 receptor domain-containing protein [Planctomycetaceae bacterium]